MKIKTLIFAVILFPLLSLYPQILTDETGDLKATRDVPKKVDFSQKMLQQLKVPKGFTVNVFAKGLKHPRMMALAPDGTVYVTDPKEDEVIALIDKNNDGVAEEKKAVLTDLENVHGITIHEGRMYLCAPRILWEAEMKSDGTILKPRELLTDLPEGGRHENRTLAFGPDGFLYISIGSSCNACKEKNPEHAAIIRIKPDGSARMTYARGLRNTIGFGWHPETKDMWGMDNGSDWRGNDAPPEELNRLVEGGNYGWPYCYGDGKADPDMDNPDNMTKEEYCKKTIPMAMGYTPHTAPIAMVFYDGGMFPKEYKNDAFSAMHGSWNKKPPAGYEVIRIHFENGKPVKFEQFLKGFLFNNGKSQFGRPAGLCVAKDGSLLVSDDNNGVIYRVSYGSKGR
ncbi:MAG: sorbosone dehydrogenase family protein [Ignavibacteria bacterium]|jgi:glucose/arabinose dehydrogenase|nr:sorbosone dehydrogenase family protein [Ignavibacteria bacterium]MCU7504669.1 sorbosone dehydrogenase family protein [Ignavibacteria bacterium]MCU7517523.1 sorbosone dehydrogenase family protein [Ignavibacteria bacterium]